MARPGIHDFTPIRDYTHPIIPVRDREWTTIFGERFCLEGNAWNVYSLCLWFWKRIFFNRMFLQLIDLLILRCIKSSFLFLPCFGNHSYRWWNFNFLLWNWGNKKEELFDSLKLLYIKYLCNIYNLCEKKGNENIKKIINSIIPTSSTRNANIILLFSIGQSRITEGTQKFDRF